MVFIGRDQDRQHKKRVHQRTAQLEHFDKVKESRLRWFRNVQRRECGYIGQKMNMELLGRRRKGRMFMVVVKDNMQRVGVMEADVEKGQSNVVNTKKTLLRIHTQDSKF